MQSSRFLDPAFKPFLVSVIQNQVYFLQAQKNLELKKLEL